MKVKVIQTGSDGNCIKITDKNTSLLIDAGYATNGKMQEHLANEEFQAILITHEHTDHFSNWTGRLAIERNIPIYLHPRHYETEETRKKKYLSYESKKEKMTYYAKTIDIYEEKTFTVNHFNIFPFLSYHDARKTLGYKFLEQKFALLTDCGFISKKIKNTLKDVEHLALEFNYDTSILMNSDRFVGNKLRTLGKFGHLNIEEAIKFVHTLPNLKTLITLHSSEANCNLQTLKERLKKEFPNLHIYVSERQNNPEIILEE